MQIGSSGRFLSEYSPGTADLYEYYLGFIKRHHLQYFSLFALPAAENDRPSDLMLVSNWPNTIVDLHNHIGFWEGFPTAEIRDFEPQQNILELTFPSDREYNERQQRILRLLKKCDLDCCIGSIVQTTAGNAGVVTFSSSTRPIKVPDLRPVIEQSGRVLDEIMDLRLSSAKAHSRLSKREHECLLWTSQGKTSYEIGMILGLSENTINNYLVAAGRKLRAVNRPHMVRIALEEGIIK